MEAGCFQIPPCRRPWLVPITVQGPLQTVVGHCVECYSQGMVAGQGVMEGHNLPLFNCRVIFTSYPDAIGPQWGKSANSAVFSVKCGTAELIMAPQSCSEHMNSMKVVIPLHSLYWSIHTKDESKRGPAFAFIFGVN